MGEMTWLAIAGALLVLWLLFKTFKFIVKVLIAAVVLGGLYWFLAPLLDLPLPIG